MSMMKIQGTKSDVTCSPAGLISDFIENHKKGPDCCANSRLWYFWNEKGDIATLQYNVTQIVLSACGGDTLLEKVEESFKRGETPNELELIFLPLMQSRLTPQELLRRVIILEKEYLIQIIAIKVRDINACICGSYC